jgi:hypothetical protein
VWVEAIVAPTVRPFELIDVNAGTIAVFDIVEKLIATPTPIAADPPSLAALPSAPAAPSVSEALVIANAPPAL